MSRRNSILFVLAVAVVWTLLDQWTKYLAVADLTRLFPDDAGLFERLALFYGTDDLRRLATAPVRILPIWEHVYVQNPSGAFGLLGNLPFGVRRAILVIFAMVAAVFLLVLAGKNAGPGKNLLRLCLALVLGGAVGNNALDRAIHGYVIDFIHWHWRGLSWPPFNIADVGIVVGAIGLFVLLWLEERSSAKAETPQPRSKRRR